MGKTLLPLTDALKLAQQMHIILQATSRSVNLWTTDNRVPPVLRDTIKANRTEVRKLVLTGDVRTCVNPTLHRKEWRHAGNQCYICGICERLKFVS